MGKFFFQISIFYHVRTKNVWKKKDIFFKSQWKSHNFSKFCRKSFSFSRIVKKFRCSGTQLYICSIRNISRLKVKNRFSVIEHLSSVSSLVFVIIRVVSLALTFIVFHFGFGHQPSTQWNTPRTRILALLVVSFVQVCSNFNAWLMRSYFEGEFCLH